MAPRRAGRLVDGMWLKRVKRLVVGVIQRGPAGRGPSLGPAGRFGGVCSHFGYQVEALVKARRAEVTQPDDDEA